MTNLPTPNMIFVQPRVILLWHNAGAPWRCRVEFKGMTSKGGVSSKFWEVYSQGAPHPVYFNYGKIGTLGQSTIDSFDHVLEAISKLDMKLDKGGYELVRDSTAIVPIPGAEMTQDLVKFMANAWFIIRDEDSSLWLVNHGAGRTMQLTEQGARQALSWDQLRVQTKVHSPTTYQSLLHPYESGCQTPP